MRSAGGWRRSRQDRRGCLCPRRAVAHARFAARTQSFGFVRSDERTNLDRSETEPGVGRNTCDVRPVIAPVGHEGHPAEIRRSRASRRRVAGRAWTTRTSSAPAAASASTPAVTAPFSPRPGSSSSNAPCATAHAATSGSSQTTAAIKGAVAPSTCSAIVRASSARSAGPRREQAFSSRWRSSSRGAGRRNPRVCREVRWMRSVSGFGDPQGCDAGGSQGEASLEWRDRPSPEVDDPAGSRR